jgi:predicted nucleic acid-binding protein
MSADQAGEFVDSNVIVYMHDLDAGSKRRAALALIERLASEGTANISIQVLQEVFVTLTRKIRRPLSAPIAAAVLADLSRMRVHEPKVSDVLAATEIHERHGISFWDAMIVRSAQGSGSLILWTEDLAPRVYEGVEVRSPF